MDNASKALRIAGAVLLGLMVTSLLLFAYNTWTKYQKTNLETIQSQQATKFNATFDVYNKKALRGSDLVSLGNKLNSTNRSIAGERDYNIYDKSEAEKKNMNYRYPETDLMPVRAFVEFHVNSNETNYPIMDPNALPGMTYYYESTLGPEDYYGPLTLNYGASGKMVDLDEFIQKIYNNDKLCDLAYKEEKLEVKKVFKGYYFECTGVEFDSRNGRYCRLYFKQVFKIN